MKFDEITTFYAVLYFPGVHCLPEAGAYQGAFPLTDSCSIIGKQHLFLPDIFQNFMQYLLDGKVLKLYLIIK